MRLDTFFISVMLALMFIAGGLLVITANTTTYDVTVTDPIFTEVQGEMDGIYSNATAMKDKITGQEISGDTAENNLFSGAFNALPFVWQMFKSVPSLIYKVGIAFGIPPILISSFLIIILLGLVFSMIYTFMRFMPR